MCRYVSCTHSTQTKKKNKRRNYGGNFIQIRFIGWAENTLYYNRTHIWLGPLIKKIPPPQCGADGINCLEKFLQTYSNLKLFTAFRISPLLLPSCSVVGASWNVTAHAQKPDFVFRRNGRVHLNRQGRQISRLLAPDVCASAVVMLDTPCSEVV